MSALVQIKRTIEEVRDFPGFGDRLRSARLRDPRPLTQICKAAGISRQYWYGIENETIRTPVSVEVVQRIESALGIDLGVNFEG